MTYVATHHMGEIEMHLNAAIVIFSIYIVHILTWIIKLSIATKQCVIYKSLPFQLEHVDWYSCCENEFFPQDRFYNHDLIEKRLIKNIALKNLIDVKRHGIFN
jgi:hypothetical protein